MEIIGTIVRISEDDVINACHKAVNDSPSTKGLSRKEKRVLRKRKKAALKPSAILGDARDAIHARKWSRKRQGNTRHLDLAMGVRVPLDLDTPYIIIGDEPPKWKRRRKPVTPVLEVAEPEAERCDVYLVDVERNWRRQELKNQMREARVVREDPMFR